jgi:hypothetical protein
LPGTSLIQLPIDLKKAAGDTWKEETRINKSKTVIDMDGKIQAVQLPLTEWEKVLISLEI